jgi:hypothetical protein
MELSIPELERFAPVNLDSARSAPVRALAA